MPKTIKAKKKKERKQENLVGQNNSAESIVMGYISSLDNTLKKTETTRKGDKELGVSITIEREFL